MASDLQTADGEMDNAPAPRPWKRPVIVVTAILAVAALSGASLGYYLRLDLPDVNGLEDYSPPVMTRVLADDGSLLDNFFEERRILVEYQDIPESFRQALIATEDSNFYAHAGVDLIGVARAAWRNLLSLRRAQGGSTLTQQLARSLFLHPEKTFRRKFQEAVLALEIERQYTKEEILRFYCNQVYMGHGRYGLEAAARFYLDKPARELTLEESAVLAGLIQRPESLSPFKNPERSTRRRNHVLSRMVDEGYLDPQRAEQAMAAPVPAPPHRRPQLAPYFVEDVRRWLQERYGNSSLYRSGLEVRTTLDPALQAAAERAVDAGLRELDRRQGWRGAPEHVAEDEDLSTWSAASWREPLENGQVTDGIVMRVEKGRAVVRVDRWTGSLGAKEIDWTGVEDPARLLKVGDVPRVRILELDEDGSARLVLEQEPAVEAALVALDPASGAVRALVGGFDFSRSEFDRAIQARRQTGSAFKPFVFAAALASGWTMAQTLVDQPTVFIDPKQPVPYVPRNYKNDYYGRVTLRRALEKSANVATVRLLNRIGAPDVISLARRLGISGDLQPYPSLALGSFEVSLIELTSAYGTFANQGVRVEPHLVESVVDRGGTVLFRMEPEVRDAVEPRIAHLMNRMLGGVITDGTGRAAADLGLELAGKTGTTDDSTDAWFIGYSADLAVGVWVGFDAKRSLGDRETGAQAALPIWRGFMKGAYAEHEDPGDFPVPDGITVAVIDRNTGLRANPAAGCPRFSEVFVAGTEPTRYCSHAEHSRLRFPYPFHAYPLNEQGALVIPELDLQELLACEPDVWLAEAGARIEYGSSNGMISLPLEIVPGSGRPILDPAILNRMAELEEEPGPWLGTDGREALVEIFRP